MSDLLGVSFGTYHTWRDWGLYLMGPASVSLPVVRTNYVDVPGRDGYLDLSDALTGETVYETRDFSVPLMSLASPEDWPGLYSGILNAIHGQKVQIILDEDPGYYYTGRVAVDSPSYDGTWQFNINGVLNPYKRKRSETVVECGLDGTEREIVLTNGRMPVVPTVTVDGETELAWGGERAVLAAGTHILPGLRLTQGAQVLKARAAGGAGTLTITYREGSL